MVAKGGMQGLMKQAQKMQKQMQKAQEELANEIVEGSAGGGMVVVKVNGKKEIKNVKINPEILSEDVEMVEDLILAAVNQAMQNAEELANSKMGNIQGGLGNSLSGLGL
ncbi:MAG: YbaB/EbfC family nucleoid-associated protein [Candidatus Marinimicrobia bacterium]|jgi:DNA-binding YbaB/EbfC family protein|nr:YbaB/EbfC family nucleoid-associated protein [Candidatus Neomarinimicrobiota bacterium]